jgi:hypothetical protein
VFFSKDGRGGRKFSIPVFVLILNHKGLSCHWAAFNLSGHPPETKKAIFLLEKGKKVDYIAC